MTPTHFSNEALMALDIAGLAEIVPDLERMADSLWQLSDAARLPPYFAKVAAEHRARTALIASIPAKRRRAR